ncbi:rhamnan synthesis protein F [Sphingomonas sp. PP-F2F-G114-C0414]|uniref:rhamnan synthesis F family protein n=1 Tax=Sphingomonas sp. PP-F2F-G114-C0414 TaxID=2135662 RepID=UPI000EF8E678|nr:rhamnan synthesis F family protein [Sphingomonas sp. PP-F2F-G114-C0414]RMB25744.1 rhamnan synthesis protein F [Sphingomonas sp. PP-F2F-G114-C0414]
MSDPIDYAFCRKQHGFQTDEQVRDWFSQATPLDYRTFSPNFSPIDYLVENEDLVKAGAHPVTHYLSSGRAERRPIKPATELRGYDAENAATRDMAPADARVVIVLHIYYPTFVPYFISRLLALGGLMWDVMISASADVIREHEETLRVAFGDRLRILMEVPNRGRNFAPLLVDFAAELSAYDAICHCHSKESLHSGRRQTAWADYLIASLIGSQDVMRRHVNLILSGACDVISPAPFIGMPPWASHSLSNDAHFTEMCARLGLDGTTGFMAYPVGGMLWMSKTVHASLASMALKHDDFPPEPSRPDGELHHALERLIGRLAGRKQAFYDQVTGRYWAPDAVLREEVRRSANAGDLPEIINGHDIVTFDFFDTLCTRSTGDEEWAKRRVEFAIGQNYHMRRNAVEAQLRAGLHPGEDVSLPLIAQALTREGFIDAIGAVALERAFDLATLVPRPQIVHAYEHAIEKEKMVLIVSDSYYDQGFIRSFLLKHGIPEPKQILISADVGLRKDRGDLWHHLGRVRGNSRGLHVGDNVHSDIQKASEQGFSGFYVQHWRHELLPFSGFSRNLLKRNLTNPGFARSTDRAAPEVFDDDLQERYLDIVPRRGVKRRNVSKNRVAR